MGTQDKARAPRLHLDVRHGDVAVDAVEDLEVGAAGAALLDLGVIEPERFV
jgi:hypothetical protein